MSDALKQTLLRAEYEGIEFPTSSHPVNAGHTIVEHAGHMQAGFDLEESGFNGARGSFVVPLFNGLRTWGNDLYPGVFNRLRQKFRSKPIGRLTHPLEGVLTVGIKSWSYDADAQKRNGLVLSFEWVQRRADDTSSLLLFRNDARDTPATVARRATVADAVATGATGERVAPSSYTPLSEPTSEQLSLLTTAQSRSTAQSAINSMLSLITANIAAVESDTYASSYAALLRELYSLRASVLDARAVYVAQSAAVFRPTTDMTAWEIAADPSVYGDAQLAHLIIAANNFSNPLRIRAGTYVEIPPRF